MFNNSTREREDRKTCVEKWDDNRSDTFISNIAVNQIRSLLSILEFRRDDDVTEKIINNVAEMLSTVLTSAAECTFGSYKPQPESKRKINNKQWFDTECRDARECFRVAKKQHR